MNKETRQRILNVSWKLHSEVESSYLKNPSKPDDEDWLIKQKLLLADMALHLLQTSIRPGKMELDKLRNNLHSILTISDQFIPEAELKMATERLFSH